MALKTINGIAVASIKTVNGVAAASVKTWGGETWTHNTYATWNPSDKHADITLSGGNLVATNSVGGAWRSARSTISKSSGKWYWECTATVFNGADASAYGAVGNSTASLASYLGSDTNGKMYYSGGSYYYNAAESSTAPAPYVQGDVIGVALDADTGNVEFFLNNVSQGVESSAVTGPYFAGTSIYRLADAVTANFGATALTYSPPSGYNAGLYS